MVGAGHVELAEDDGGAVDRHPPGGDDALEAEVVEGEDDTAGQRSGGRLPRPAAGPFDGRQGQLLGRSVGRRQDTGQRCAERFFMSLRYAAP